jgi:hypothetical protein
MKTHVAIFSLVLLTSLLAFGVEESDSLLGKPLSSLIGPIAKFKIVVSQSKGQAVVLESDARFALEHSKLIDPTLPEVRKSDFPMGASLYLTSTNGFGPYRVDLSAGHLGLYREGVITYVFRYEMPKDWPREKN